MSLLENLTDEEIKQLLSNFLKTEKSLTKSDKMISVDVIASMIDHTLLKPEATQKEIEQLCEEAIKHNFASVCINPSYVSFCFDKIKSSSVRVCTVIGFPLGATTTQTKVTEAEEAVKNGCEELDMVINVGKLKDKDYNFIFNDVKSVADLAKKYMCKLKVILETCLLTDEEKVAACLISKEAGADFVKTSTGFSKEGATVHDVALMKYIVGDNLGVKASGGIRTYDDAVNMINAGASRLGASAGVKIISNQESESNY